jgi:hypothetical protein
MPGTPENVNAVRHGGRSRRNGIVLAALASRHAAIAVDLRRLKRTLDPYVQQRQGADRLRAVAMANEICRWEMSSRVMQKTMATESLSPELTLSYLNSIGNATRNRNALISKLLDGQVDPADPWASLDALPMRSGVATGQDVSEGRPARQRNSGERGRLWRGSAMSTATTYAPARGLSALQRRIIGAIANHTVNSCDSGDVRKVWANRMEQKFRPLVIDRKITQGTRGEPGRRWCERIWTALATCAQRGRRAFVYLCEAIDAYLRGQVGPSLLAMPP